MKNPTDIVVMKQVSNVIRSASQNDPRRNFKLQLQGEDVSIITTPSHVNDFYIEKLKCVPVDSCL